MNQTFVSILLTVATIFMIAIVGYVVIDRMGQHYWVAVGFCIDKNGTYNMSDYDIIFNDYVEIINCSNKENPVMIDTALSY